MPRHIFREYDIRGVAEHDLGDDLVTALGDAFAERVAPGPVAVGRDCRLTSPRLFEALCRGLRRRVEVIDLGMVPSPVLYFAAHTLTVTGAIVITGSHNPPEDNGFKLLAGSSALHGAEIANLGAEAERRLGRNHQPTHPLRAHDIIPAYLEHAATHLRLGPRRLRVVVDAGNGSGGPTAVALYQKLGFDVVPLFCEPDGRFPNHHPDPTMPANLAALIDKVHSSGAELGIALDGDADRIGAVDGTGRILWGDQLMILLGRALLAETPGAKFVGEVKCSQSMYDELARAGGSAEMWKVGHSLIKARMRETGAALGGEMSGHIFFAHRYLGFDDGIYAGARLLELLSRSELRLAEHAATLPVSIATPEIRIACPDDQKFSVVAKIAARMRARTDVVNVVDIDGVRASFGNGWGLVRASNTQPALVLRCEANDLARLAELERLFAAEIDLARAP